LVESGGTHIQPAEAIPARFYPQERLDLAIDQECVAHDAIQAHQVEKDFAILVKDFVGKVHPDIELREAGQMKPRVFIAGVKLIEEQIVPVKSLVDVLRRMINAVVVIPQRTQRFINVTALIFVGGENSSQHIWVVLVIELSPLEEIAGVAVAFRGSVTVVQMCGNRRQSKPSVTTFRWEIIEIAHEYSFPISGHVCGTRHHSVKCPEILDWEILVDADSLRPLMHLVKLLRREDVERLMGNYTTFPGIRVRHHRGC